MTAPKSIQVFFTGRFFLKVMHDGDFTLDQEERIASSESFDV